MAVLPFETLLKGADSVKTTTVVAAMVMVGEATAYGVSITAPVVGSAPVSRRHAPVRGREWCLEPSLQHRHYEVNLT
jgi:hypothetical protein